MLKTVTGRVATGLLYAKYLNSREKEMILLRRKAILRELSNRANDSEKFTSEDEVKEVIESLIEMKNLKTKIINKKNGKRREVIDTSNLLAEEVLVLKYYQLLLNRIMDIRAPQRNYIIHELLNIIPYINLYHNYTIYKFDFKDFFYSVDNESVKKIISKNTELRESELIFFDRYLNDSKSLYPGIGMHNTFIEIVGKKFDASIKKEFYEQGLLFFARYVDDCILILDEKYDKQKLEVKIMELAKKSFGDNVRLHPDKSKYITKSGYNEENNWDLEYLGYCFNILNKKFKIGIAQNKINKCKIKLNELLNEYKNTQNEEKLSLKLDVFYKRLVFYENGKWKVRGMSQSYREIKRFANKEENITVETLRLFGSYIEEFFEQNQLVLPEKLKCQIKDKKFFNDFKFNRAILLNKQIGYEYSFLLKQVKVLTDYTIQLSNKSYQELLMIFMDKYHNT